MSSKDLSLAVKHGLIVLNTATFTEIPECDPEFYAIVRDEFSDFCSRPDVDSRTPLLCRKPDGTICKCYCR